MNEVKITVRGEHETHVAPERAKIHVTVNADGPGREAVLTEVMNTAKPVRESLQARSDAGAIVDWSSAALSVRAERPWHSEGKRLAPVYYASAAFTATFADFSELALWVVEVSAREGVTVGHVHWHLTPETHAKIERETATEAIRVAVTRAEAYAAALDLNHVSPVSVADRGLLRGEEAVPMMRAVALAADSSGGSTPDLEPEDIVISATVEADFVAR